MPRTFGSEKVEGGNNSASGGRIAAAPQSAAKIEALAQVQLINNDCVQSESQVSQIAAARRQQVNTYFSGARQGLSQFFIGSVIAVQTFIAGKQAEIIAAVARTLAWIRTAITGALQAVQTIAGQIRARINQILESITTSVQNRVAGIAGQITGLIDSIPLPDIPGIGQIRAGAASMLNRAAGAVSGAFGRFFSFVGRAFNAGMNLLGSFLNIITQFANIALSAATAAILSVLQMITQMINRAVALLGSTLRGVLFAVLIPLLNGMEGLVTRLIGIVEQRAIGLLRSNRDEYLSSLAEAVAPKTTAKNAAAVSTETLIAVIQQLGRDAIQNSRQIVQTIASFNRHSDHCRHSGGGVRNHAHSPGACGTDSPDDTSDPGRAHPGDSDTHSVGASYGQLPAGIDPGIDGGCAKPFDVYGLSGSTRSEPTSAICPERFAPDNQFSGTLCSKPDYGQGSMREFDGCAG